MCRIRAISKIGENGMSDQLTLFAEGLPASPSPAWEGGKDWRTLEGISPSNFSDWQRNSDPDGLYGKMSPESCQAGEDGILEPSSGRWQNSGMAAHGDALTFKWYDHATSPELSLSDADVSTLSDVLDPISEVHPRHYLSPRACRGILRRADEHGQDIPGRVREMLERAAEG